MTSTSGMMMRDLHRANGIRVAGQETRLIPCHKMGHGIGPRLPPRRTQLPMKVAGVNRPGARRGNRHNSATLGPSILVANRIGPVASKLGAAAMEETGMANGTENGAINGANLFDNRIEKTLIDPASTPVISRSGCSGRRLSSDSCASKIGGGHSCSRRSKD